MHKAWHAWTCVDFGQNNSGQDSRPGEGGDAADCAGVGFGAIRAGGFLAAEAAGGFETVAGAYFRGRGACTQYDPKVILGAKTLDLNCEAYYGSVHPNPKGDL